MTKQRKNYEATLKLKIANYHHPLSSPIIITHYYQQFSQLPTSQSESGRATEMHLLANHPLGTTRQSKYHIRHEKITARTAVLVALVRC